ncbi:uncharacterized protein KY384_004660 [Bacidia gigantensis]|uniref:uncharacterized protein n=1 Tax=Bacidia gigantensis TaxID=2732470 RepID=UPI001D054C99|nr:uncharacterized protein KY384_004660 [Bacidia gigantensis]KAG8530622.1 hypothetical protein KY384_004660 [Bacidia gigantensis]
MSHLFVDSVISAEDYNRLVIDHEATERAALLDLKRNHLPALSQTLISHGVADFVELHLLHRHFRLQEGEAMVHKTLTIPKASDVAAVTIDIAKAMDCAEPVKSSLVPLLWMACPSGEGLVAYEYGLGGSVDSHKREFQSISAEAWSTFARAFTAHVHAAGIADLVSLKDKDCINGGEYVVPDMRVLFRVPTSAIDLQPGSGVLESGWDLNAKTESNAGFPECTDGHVTKTRRTKGGSVAHYHSTTKNGIDAFNPKEVPLPYTNAMWATSQSENFWAVNSGVDVTA